MERAGSGLKGKGDNLVDADAELVEFQRVSAGEIYGCEAREQGKLGLSKSWRENGVEWERSKG